MSHEASIDVASPTAPRRHLLTRVSHHRASHRHSPLLRTALVTVVAVTSLLVPLTVTGVTVADASGSTANCTVDFTNNTSPAPISATGTNYVSDSGQTYSGDVGAAFTCTGLPTGDDYDVITATQSVGGYDNSFQFPMYWDQACNGNEDGTFPTNWSATLPVGYGPGDDVHNTYTGGSGCVYIQPYEHWLTSLGGVTYSGDTYPFPGSILVSTDGGETRTLITATVNGFGIIASTAVGLATGEVVKSGTSCSHGKYPVNCASGDFWHTFTDASIPGYGPGLDLTRTYNSLEASTEGIFGYGWTSSYESHLTVNGDGSITITEADGSQVTAEPNGSSGFNVPSWADSTLTSSGGNYTFVRQGTETYSFNSSGLLTALTDTNGYSTTLTHMSGKLTTVTNSAGRTLTLAYGSNGLVSSVTDPMSRVRAYAYDSSGDLTSVTDPLSRVTSFTYNTTSHLLLTMTFPNGQSGGPDAGDSVTNTYNSSGQVVTQTDTLKCRITRTACCNR